MRVLMGIVLSASVFLLNSCDRGSKPKEQVQGASVAQTETIAKVVKADQILMSKDGARASLSYAMAGKSAPTTPFTGADGRDVNLSDFAGRPLLVNLWATWCAPCKAEMPALDKLAAAQNGALTVIVVSQDLEGRKVVSPYFAQAKIANLEPYTDSDNALLPALKGDGTLPMTVLFDSDGKEVWRITGAADWNDPKILALMGQAG